MIDLSIEKAWGDAWAVYKLLFRGSVVTAAIVYAVIDGIDLLADALDRRWATGAVAVAAFLSPWPGRCSCRAR